MGYAIAGSGFLWQGCQMLSASEAVASLIDPKVRQIGELLRAEESQFVDFSTISQRSGELGFHTSVRTLRFYVNEGILPSPRRQRTTPVYPEREILNLLLAIHLMKTRFHRSRQ